MGVADWTHPKIMEEFIFEQFLSEKPPLDELCEYVRVGTKWYMVGLQLKLDVESLDAIEELNRDLDYKTTKMFHLWLDSKHQASRRQIINVLKKSIIGKTSLAQQYETTVRELCVTTTTCKFVYFNPFSQSLTFKN